MKLKYVKFVQNNIKNMYVQDVIFSIVVKLVINPKKHKCAETFFKENFMNLLKGEKASDSSRNEIIQILRKLEEEDTNELEYEKESGSESEDDIADRFSELNLDNMNIEAIWNKLNDKEKKQFNDLLSNPKELNSQLDEIVIPWKPWWEYKQNNKENKKIIIEEMGNVQKQDITTSNNKNNSLYFPSLNDSIQKLSNTSNKPKVFLGYNLIDILLTYVYVTRYFNGEIYDYIKETCEIIWELTTILENDLQYNFNNIEEILESKNINFQKKQIIYNFEHTIMNIEDTINILNSRENILLVLSDLIKIFTIYQEYIKEEKKKLFLFNSQLLI